MLPRNSQGFDNHAGNAIKSERSVQYSCLLENRLIPVLDILGLQGHLKRHFPIMNRLYLALNNRPMSPTDEEIELARGSATMDPVAANEYLGKVESATADIVKAFEAQARKATVCFPTRRPAPSF